MSVERAHPPERTKPIPAIEPAGIASWTFVSEVPIPPDVHELLVKGEQPVAAYKTFRDSAVFPTNA